MPVKKIFLNLLPALLIAVTLLPISAFSASPDDHGEIKACGMIKEQGVTTYMYGTHVLIDASGKTAYALKSDRTDLSKFSGQKVCVEGTLIQGYPVDFGPPYLDVASVEPSN